MQTPDSQRDEHGGLSGQLLPEVLRVQLRDWLDPLFPQLPELHVWVVTDRLCVPVSSHVLEKPPHAPHDPYVVAAHVTPLVLRVHAWLCDDALLPQAPATQLCVVTVLDCVPVVSHVLVKPPQAPHDPYVVVVHPVPSVSRAHAWVPVDPAVVQLPAVQRGVVTVRACDPLSSHVLVKLPHAPHAP